MQRTYIFLASSLCIISTFNNQLFSADRKNPLLLSDTNQHIFEHGTEKINRALRCTCTTLNVAGERYHHAQAIKLNEKFKGIESIIVPVMGNSTSCVVPSIIILPGGKQCSVVSRNNRYFVDLQQIFEKGKVEYDKFTHGILNDPERKCCISIFSLNKTPNVQGPTYLSVMVPSKNYDLFNVSRSTDISLQNNTFTVQTYNLNKHDSFPYEVSFLFNHNQLKATKHTQELSLAGNTVFYGALQGTTASDEYERDCWTATDEGHIHVPEVPLEVVKAKYTEQYRLKKDSLLHDMRAQKALHAYVSEGGYALAQDIAQDGYTANDLVNLYIVTTFWTGDDLVIDGCLQVLCDREIEINRQQEKTQLNRTLSTLGTIITAKINPFKSPFRNVILDKETVKNWNGELAGTLKEMKQNCVTSYDAYLNAVTNFITHECKEWEREKNKQ